MFTNKILLITGGTGSFGNAVIKRFLNSGIKEIRIFSRDGKGQMSEDRCQKSEVRGQKSEVRGQRSEGKDQRPEDRSQRPDVRGQRSGG